jgi:predicted metal-binding membrane protein
MKDKPVISLQRREQFLIISSLLIIVVLAWYYLLILDKNMPEMSGMSMGVHPWMLNDFIMMFLMWVIMMIGMMVPSAMRTVLIYSRIVHKAQASGRSIAPTYFFVSGYIVIWCFFSIAATLLQWQLESLALVSPMMVVTSSYLGAGLLICAGLYQLTPLKDVCLKHCQSPTEFITRNYKKGTYGAFLLGLKHGTYCLGCCWVLMLLLFVGGVMNLIWILAISLFVLLEKLLPVHIKTTRLTSVVMIVSGLVFLLKDSASLILFN